MKAKTPEGMIGEVAAAKILGYTVASLKKWRVLGKGPAFYKLRSRVLYKRDDITKFLAELNQPVRVDPKPELARRSA